MVRYRPAGRPLWTSTIVLLALTAVLAAALGYQAWDAGRSHEAVARASLREQTVFAASTFAREARGEVLIELFEEGIEVVESASGRSGLRPLTYDRLRRAARSNRWRAMEDAILFFRLQLSGEEFDWQGRGGEKVAAWARETTLAFARDNPDEHEIELIFAREQPDVMVLEVSHDGPDDSTIHGFILPVAAVGEAFDRAFEDEPLLPGALTSGLANGEIFIARVTSRDGRVVYESSADSSSNVVVHHPLHPELGGMVLELGVSDPAVDLLVSGGVPDSRIPFIVMLLVLTSGLLGTAIWQLRKEAELAELREDFISGISHQLLTPLTQIRMFGETLQLGRIRNDQEQARAVEIIVDESTRLAHQVENVLTFSRGRRDALRLQPVETDLAALVREVIEGYEPLAAAEGACIRTALESETYCSLDPEATRQVVLNLLDNAVKYGPSGQVVEVGVLRSEDGDGVMLWVDDEGPGIPAADRQRIWEPYVRLDRDGESSSGGSGIGLAVVRRTVEALGGVAEVETSRRTGSRGARFVIRLPVAGTQA